jgi:hypothetical protein
MDWVDELRREGVLDSGGLLGADSVRLSLGLHGPTPGAGCAPGAPIRLYFVLDAVGIDRIFELAARCPSAQPGTIDVLELEAARAPTRADEVGARVG